MFTAMVIFIYYNSVADLNNYNSYILGEGEVQLEVRNSPGSASLSGQSHMQVSTLFSNVSFICVLNIQLKH